MSHFTTTTLHSRARYVCFPRWSRKHCSSSKTDKTLDHTSARRDYTTTAPMCSHAHAHFASRPHTEWTSSHCSRCHVPTCFRTGCRQNRATHHTLTRTIRYSGYNPHNRTTTATHRYHTWPCSSSCYECRTGAHASMAGRSPLPVPTATTSLPHVSKGGSTRSHVSRHPIPRRRC